MENTKEFQGKSLDEAIQNACRYFDAKREKLEIDIVQDAKSGLFGIVGVRKAIIRAKLAGSVRGSVSAILHGNEPCFENDATAAGRRADESVEKPVRSACSSKASSQSRSEKKQSPSMPCEGTPQIGKKHASCSQERQLRSAASAAAEAVKAESPVFVHQEQDDKTVEKVTETKEKEKSCLQSSEEEPLIPFQELEQAQLVSVTEDAVRHLITPILGDVPVRVEVGENHVDVHVNCGEQSGLLIGREGQTLSALQYLISRIVSTQLKSAVRVQINVGDYRERQDERLRELAFVLAERVRTTGRSCSTRPMSSYHRRIIHLALQDSPDVQTRSSGEGPLKRIIVQKRKTA